MVEKYYDEYYVIRMKLQSIIQSIIKYGGNIMGEIYNSRFDLTLEKINRVAEIKNQITKTTDEKEKLKLFEEYMVFAENFVAEIADENIKLLLKNKSLSELLYEVTILAFEDPEECIIKLQSLVEEPLDGPQTH